MTKKRYEIEDLRNTVHIAIITIREDEFNAVFDRFHAPDYAEKERRYEVGELETIDKQRIRYVLIRCTRPGEGEAQSVTNAVINDLNPNLIMLIGIGGAVPSYDFTLGDVVCARRVNDYCVSAVKQNQLEEFDLSGGEMHGRIRNLLGSLPKIWREIPEWNTSSAIGMEFPDVDIPVWNSETNRYSFHDKIYGDKNWKEKVSETFQHHFKEKKRPPLATSQAVATSDRLHKSIAPLEEWLRTARSVAAVEMELGGVYLAARTVDREYPILAVRGISDVVGYIRKEEWTKYACSVAASFAYSLVCSGELREILGR